MIAGAFARWQPRYAEYGIPTFPVRFEGADKLPEVTGYLKLGVGYSQHLAIRFPANDAFGFAVGKRTGITVLDIDTEDERVRDETFSRYGEPAIVVRTLRGRWQGWYRHAGEPRRIKPWPDQPIDLLGGGFVVAPPSQGPRGQYEFVQGGLDDLARLRPIRGLSLASPVAKVREGERDRQLWRYSMKQAPHCDDLDALIDVARTFAESSMDLQGDTHRFTEADIVAKARSAWRYETENRNLFGRGAALVVTHEEVDSLLAENADAAILLLKLRRHHWGREFVLANALAGVLGWRLPRFKAARACLVGRGVIRCVHPGGRGPGDAPRYRWA